MSATERDDEGLDPIPTDGEEPNAARVTTGARVWIVVQVAGWVLVLAFLGSLVARLAYHLALAGWRMG